jgi:uncharacterized cupredoxin-like copper-binding protein
MHKTFAIAVLALLSAAGAGGLFAHDKEGHSAGPVSKETSFGRAADPAKAQRTILVDMSDAYRFSPDNIELKTGEVVRFVVVNSGRKMHEMVLGTMRELEEHHALMKKDPKGMQHDDPSMAHVAPGKSGVIVWQFTQPGDYFFGCLIDDHFELGMIGKIRVSGPAVAGAGESAHGEHAAHAAHAAHGDQHAHGMRAWFGPYAMTREASGTSWQPEASPHQGLHEQRGAWDTMAHGYAQLIYDRQGGPRGDTKTFANSMFMFMANRPLGDAGTFGLRAMVSADPLFGRNGYPLLLQTGETANGRTPLIDRQHPHDLFMELSASYSHKVSDRSSVFVYVGLPGEPALGPPAFMHRFSGEDNPEAPISHHWIDSTHITYGVATLGYVFGDFKLEGSVFRGREPDQSRYNIETGRLDSASMRLSYNPSKNWALQVSRGHIKSPEQLHADENVNRTTASAIYHRDFGAAKWQTTVAWGRNAPSRGQATRALLLESAIQVSKTHTFFARAERADKNELFLPGDPRDHEKFQVGKLTAGYVYDFPSDSRFRFGVGGLVSRYSLPAELHSVYGSSPASYMLFARIKFL